MGQCLGKKPKETKPSSTEEGEENVASEPMVNDASQEVEVNNRESADIRPMSKVFVVGSGKLGAAALKNLSENYIEKVDIFAGAYDDNEAEELREISGATVQKISKDDTEGLTLCLKGVDAVLIAGTIGGDSSTESAINFVSAAKDADVKYVVVISSFAAKSPDDNLGVKYKELEQGISDLEIPFTILRLPFVIDSLCTLFAPCVKSESQISAPVSGDKEFSHVLMEDAAKAAAKVLADPSSHAGKTYHFSGGQTSLGNVVTALSETLEKEITFSQGDEDSTKESLLNLGVAEQEIDHALELFRAFENNNIELDTEAAEGDFKILTGDDQKEDDFKEFIQKNKDLFA